MDVKLMMMMMMKGLTHKYKNEVSSPSNSVVIESGRFYRASADWDPLLPVQVW